MSNIPASEIVDVTPSVLSVGGTALNLSGLMLTSSGRVPIGTVPSFATADDVGDYFGPSSAEKAQADIYFAGFDGSNAKPGAMLFAQYPTSPVAAYLRGAAVSTLTLAQLQALKPVSITGSIGGSITASAGAVATGTASGVNLTLSGVTGLVSVGDTVTGTGVPANTFIVSQTSGTPGGAGVYVTNQATTASSASLTIASSVLDVTAVGSGTLQTSDALSGTGVTGGTTVTGQLSGTAGSTGTYRLSAVQQFASTTVTALSTVLHVVSTTGGDMAPNLLLTGTSVTAASRLVSQISTSPNLWSLSAASTTVQETITAAYDLSVTVNGTPATSSSIDLSAATSFSAAATTIGSAIGETVTYDSVQGAFTVTSPTTGAASTIGFGSGGLATALKLTQALGAVTSQGANAATPGAFMDSVVAVTQNWASFATLFDPDNGSGNTNKLLFAAWTNSKAPRYAYCAWDADLAPTQSSAATSSLGYLLKQSNSSGTIPIYNSVNLATFAMSVAASLDFDETNGRATFAFRAQTGLSGATPLAASVTDATVASNLQSNGYDFYGDYATANDQFSFFYPGSISGPWKWADSYVNQIWMSNAFQLALMTLLTQVKSIPYNDAGKALIQAALTDPINAAINFGAIQSGVALSAAQASEVNQAAGAKIDGVLSTRGWYLQVKTAAPSARAARSSPPCTFWYTDGGSVQQINLASIEIQ